MTASSWFKYEVKAAADAFLEVFAAAVNVEEELGTNLIVGAALCNQVQSPFIWTSIVTFLRRTFSTSCPWR